MYDPGPASDNVNSSPSPPGKRLPARQLWAGRPAQFMRELSDEEIRYNHRTAARYRELAREYLGALGFVPAPDDIA